MAGGEEEGEMGRWLGWTPGDPDGEERGGEVKGRIKVTREPPDPTPQNLHWWRPQGPVQQWDELPAVGVASCAR